MSKQPPSVRPASAVGPCPTLIQISRTPRHWIFTQHHCITRPPQKRRVNIDESKTVQSTPLAPTASAVGPCPTIINIVFCFGVGVRLEWGRGEFVWKGWVYSAFSIETAKLAELFPLKFTTKGCGYVPLVCVLQESNMTLTFFPLPSV